VTREAGVSPAAAYRHFADRDALLLAAGEITTGRLAEAMVAMQEALGGEGAELALNRLRGVGLGYITFALDEPGWFALAFATQPASGPGEPVDVVRGASRARPYALLLEALDDLVDARVLTAGQRLHAEWSCWSTVHGFADLVRTGPLRALPRDQVDLLALDVAESVITGLRHR